MQLVHFIFWKSLYQFVTVTWNFMSRFFYVWLVVELVCNFKECYDNPMFMIAVNCVGDNGQNRFCGHSAIIDPWGDAIIEAGESELLLTATIETDLVEDVRQRIPVFRDRRPELYQLNA